MDIANYDPKSHRLLTFHDAAQSFQDGSDTPRDYLERCLEKIHAIEEDVMAWEIINTEAARAAADERLEAARFVEVTEDVRHHRIGVNVAIRVRQIADSAGVVPLVLERQFDTPSGIRQSVTERQKRGDVALALDLKISTSVVGVVDVPGRAVTNCGTAVPFVARQSGARKDDRRESNG